MKKISALLAAMVLSVAAFAQPAVGGGRFVSPTDNTITATAPAPTSVITTTDGTIELHYPGNKKIVLEKTNLPGQYRVLTSSVPEVPATYLTTGTYGAYVTAGGAVVTGYGLAGLGVVILVTNTSNKGTTISGTTGSV